MHRKGKLKLRSHNTKYCSIEVVTEIGLIVYNNVFTPISAISAYRR